MDLLKLANNRGITSSPRWGPAARWPPHWRHAHLPGL